MAPSRKQNSRVVLLRIDQRKEECCALLTDVTKGREVVDYAIPGYLHGSSISRMRKGDTSNLIFRVVLLMEALRQAGATYEDAQKVLTYVEGITVELFVDTLPAFDEACIHEQTHDTEEDNAQTRALLNRSCPTRRAQWASQLTCYIAHAKTMLTVLRRQDTNDIKKRVAA